MIAKQNSEPFNETATVELKQITAKGLCPCQKRQGLFFEITGQKLKKHPDRSFLPSDNLLRAPLGVRPALTVREVTVVLHGR